MNNHHRPTQISAEFKVELEKDLEHLRNDVRPAIAQRLKSAREGGDITDNAAFEQAKEDLARLMGRMAEIEQTLREATVIHHNGTWEATQSRNRHDCFGLPRRRARLHLQDRRVTRGLAIRREDLRSISDRQRTGRTQAGRQSIGRGARTHRVVHDCRHPVHSLEPDGASVTERDDIGQLRERKLAELSELGLPVAPNRFGPIRHAEEIRDQFDTLEGQRVRVAGRLMRVRLMGKASFAHIQDSTGQLQLYFKRDDLGESKYEYFKLLDLGDLIGAEGTVFKTRTGEVSVHVDDVILLAKAFAPLPEKFHGLSDVETRYRQRYLDLIANEESRRIVHVRSAVVRSLRNFLDSHGFIEVETPVMQPLYGGAAANPFVTHYAALDMDVYLRIATELYLKRLIVGGLERVYEIGKDFRNEGFSRKHSPEFTMCELYQAYADYGDIMDLMENMVACIAQDVLGTKVVTYGDDEIDLSPPWRRLSIRESLLEYADLDIAEFPSADALRLQARSRGC